MYYPCIDGILSRLDLVCIILVKTMYIHPCMYVCMYVYTWSFPPKWGVINDKTDTSKINGLSSRYFTKTMFTGLVPMTKSSIPSYVRHWLSCSQTVRYYFIYLSIHQGRFPQCRRVTQTRRAKGQGGTTLPSPGRPICLGSNTEEEIYIGLRKTLTHIGIE